MAEIVRRRQNEAFPRYVMSAAEFDAMATARGHSDVPLHRTWREQVAGRWYVREIVYDGVADFIGIATYIAVIRVTAIEVAPRPWWLLTDPNAVVRQLRLPAELRQ